MVGKGGVTVRSPYGVDARCVDVESRHCMSAMRREIPYDKVKVRYKWLKVLVLIAPAAMRPVESATPHIRLGVTVAFAFVRRPLMPVTMMWSPLPPLSPNPWEDLC